MREKDLAARFKAVGQGVKEEKLPARECLQRKQHGVPEKGRSDLA